MKKIFILVTALVAFTYLFTLKGSLGNNTMIMNSPPFETSMERGRFAQIVSLADHGTFTVDRFSNFLRPDIAWYNGHFYPAFPPGVSFVSAPFYKLGSALNLGQIFSTIPSAIFSILTGIIIMETCMLLGTGAVAAGIAMIVFCLATVTFPYSVSLSGHPYSAFLTAAMFLIYLLLKRQPDRVSLLFWLWAAFAVNLFIDYPNLAITLPIVIMAIITSLRTHWKTNNSLLPKVAASGAGLVLILVPFFLYNYLHYGKPIAFTNTYNLKRLSIQGIAFDEKNLTNSLFAQKSYSGRFTLATLPDGLRTLLISQDRGLFVYSPVLLFLFAGFYFLCKKNKSSALLIAGVFLLDLIVYGSFDDPFGGWAFGPRYLIVSLPLIAVLVGVAYQEFVQKNSVLKIIFFVLLITSLGINLSGALTTNAVPPSVEAAGLHMKDNFLYNIDYLSSGNSSSFIYNQFLSNAEKPIEYAISLLAIVTLGVLSFPFL